LLPVQVSGLTDAIKIEAFDSGTCAIRQDATVVCWGSNNYGEIGNTTSPIPSESPQVVTGLGNVIALAGAQESRCALQADGSVKCWGYGSLGQMGNGLTTNSNPTPVTVSNLTDAVAIAGSISNFCALRTTGNVVCWGAGYGPTGLSGTANQLTPNTVPGITTATAIGKGSNHQCAVLAGGTTTCWGGYSNVFGQGEVPNSFTRTPSAASFTGVKAISGGYNYSCAHKTDNTVVCAGDNSGNQTGAGIAQIVTMATDILGSLVFWK
jgi:alpha-tubulin suppressor-like RCC1 family protein